MSSEMVEGVSKKMTNEVRLPTHLKRAVESYLGRFLLFVASLMLVIFIIDAHGATDFPSWLIHRDGSDSFAAWIEALATAGAFAAAFVAVRHSWALLQLERSARTKAEQAAERKQAENSGSVDRGRVCERG